MMRKILLLSVMVLFAFAAKAQFEIGGGIGCNLPSNQFSERAGGGLDLQALGKYAFTDKFKLVIEAGYSFLPAQSEWKDQKIAYGNVLAQYLFGTRDVRPYVEGGFIYDYYWDCRKNPEQEANVPGSKVGLTPVIGLEVSVTQQVSFDVNLRYNAIIYDVYPKFPVLFDQLNTGLNYATLHLGFIWKLEK